MTARFAIKWVDSGHEPKNPPNPSYPKGVDLDVSDGAELTCIAELPYPARRIGYYEVICNICGHVSVTTTAGRPDDPRSLKVPCRIGGGKQ